MIITQNITEIIQNRYKLYQSVSTLEMSMKNSCKNILKIRSNQKLIN